MSQDPLVVDKPASFAPADLLSRLTEMVSAVFGERRRRRADFVFTAGVIALAAKMAKADGIVLQAEIDAFLDICDIPDGEGENVSRLFNLAKRSVSGFEGYADQLGRYFGEAEDVLEDVLDGLFHIAKADGALHEDEVAYLETVAARFGISDRFASLMARHASPAGENPHGVLGTHPGMDADELRRRYRRLVAEHHPDRLIARGVPEAFVKLANERLAAINAAYDALSAQAA